MHHHPDLMIQLALDTHRSRIEDAQRHRLARTARASRRRLPLTVAGQGLSHAGMRRDHRPWWPRTVERVVQLLDSRRADLVEAVADDPR